MISMKFAAIPSQAARMAVTVGVVSRAETSLADVTGLTLDVASGRSYGFHCHGMVQCSTTAEGLGIAINGPASTDISLNAQLPTNATGGYSHGVAAAFETAVQAASGTANTTYAAFTVFGRFTTAASGTFAIRFKAESGGANSVAIQPGAVLTLFQL
jgi:hypothetical protein